MSLQVLAEKLCGASPPALLSSDLFDTVLLRDHTTEATRLAAGCARAARRLGVDSATLTQLRSSFHACAYRAVAMRNPHGEASLAEICRTLAQSLGLDDDAAIVLREAEIAVDIEHLRPNNPLMDVLVEAGAGGTRVIAVSDMYYSGADLVTIVTAVLGRQPFDTVYSSCDLQRTKHSGVVFDEVARRESVPGERIVHVGDNYEVDVLRAREAGWTAVHLPRDRSHRAMKTAGKVMAWSRGQRRTG